MDIKIVNQSEVPKFTIGQNEISAKYDEILVLLNEISHKEWIKVILDVPNVSFRVCILQALRIREYYQKINVKKGNSNCKIWYIRKALKSLKGWN